MFAAIAVLQPIAPISARQTASVIRGSFKVRVIFVSPFARPASGAHIAKIIRAARFRLWRIASPPNSCNSANPLAAGRRRTRDQDERRTCGTKPRCGPCPGCVSGFHNVFFGDWRPEAGPASAGFEFRGRAVKGGVAADAAEHALVVHVQKFSRERSLRTRMAGHLEGSRGQLLPSTPRQFSESWEL